MRIFDENGNELREEDIDLEDGYLTPDRKLIRHHDAVEGHGRQFHYTVKAFYFSDGTSYEPVSENDEHIHIDDAQAGLFSYNDIEEAGKQLRGIDLKEIEDSPAVPAQEAWDEYENIQVYHLYTQEEKDAKEREAESERRKDEFMRTGLERIEELETHRALKTEVEAVDTRIDDVDTRMNGIDQDITSVSLDISNLTSDLSLTNNDISNLDDSVSNLGNSISNLDSNISTLSSNMTMLDENITTLDSDLAETNSTVEDLVLTMADLLGGENFLEEI